MSGDRHDGAADGVSIRKTAVFSKEETDMGVFSKKWAYAAGIRALKTVAQTAAASIGTTTALGGVDWVMVLSTAVLAGVVSLLTSIAGLPEVREE